MNHANSNIKNPGLMPPDELLKRVPIAMFRLKNESLVTDGSADRFIEWVIHRFLSPKHGSSHHLLRVDTNLPDHCASSHQQEKHIVRCHSWQACASCSWRG